MCGVAGIFSLDGAPIRVGDIEKMTRALLHRGPDAEGFYKDNNVHLGSRRLSINDINNGNQPIFNENRSIVTVFNGEIYNYLKLKNELEKSGHTFKTKTDSEVLVHLYEEYGENLVNKIKGQFAFAIYDKKIKKIILGRDRAGICPLYYAIVNGIFYFSSEIKSMAQLPWFSAVPDPIGIAQALKYWTTIAPRTIFKSISCVPSSSYLTVNNKHKNIKIQEYHNFTKNSNKYRPTNTKDIEQAIRNRVTEAVKKRLFTDDSVKIGAYFSGGLDSTILAYTMKNLGLSNLKTYSVSFNNLNCDESVFQKECIKDLGSCHTELRVSNEDIVRAFPEVILHTEFPFFRTAPIPMFLLSKEVQKDGIKVILSGEGSDEIFYGYDSFKDAMVINYWANNPKSKIRPMKFKEFHNDIGTNKLKYEYLSKYYSKFLNKNDPLVPLQVKWENGKNLFDFFTEEIQNMAINIDMNQELISVLPKEFDKLNCLQRCQELEMKLLLSGYLLSSQGDRVLSAHSVEGRYPFLDEELIEFAYNIPDTLKLNGFNEKYILREAYKGIIPESIRMRKKFPYHAPSSKIFFDFSGKYPYVDELLSETQIKKVGIFDYSKVEKLISKYKNSIDLDYVSSRDDLLIMFILGTQGVFTAALNRFKHF
ncbi:asparagine synthase (glutamine-hydrolyzing) [Clostridium botulinum]|uniref:asparagine synthase (glutamine-hydrolyzing) n=1 Tax=Clostridium botulinum TaxID=1491 RepID=A0A6M0SQ66_CLOBO|nr:asparagine synthase (glutamine-hydrolyzing) [Clostridium botulinum]